MLRQGNIGGRLLDIHHKAQHQKCLYRLATARLKKINIDTLLRLYLCVCATTAKPPRGIGGCWPRGCCQGGAPESIPSALTATKTRLTFVSILEAGPGWQMKLASTPCRTRRAVTGPLNRMA